MTIAKSCRAKETGDKIKRPHAQGEKIFVSHASDKGPISQIYKEPLQVNFIKKIIIT